MPDKIDTEKMVLIYLKAGFSKAQILEKISNAPQAEKDMAVLTIDSYAASRQNIHKDLEKKALIFLGFCILVFAFAYYVLFIHDASFTAQCLAGNSISISGDPLQRGKIIGALEIVSKKNCAYVAFIYKNTPSIAVTRLTFLESGHYWPGTYRSEIDVSKTDLHAIAGVIVHEACHGYQERTAAGFNESNCATTQYNFLVYSGADSGETESLKNFAAINPAYSIGGRDVFEEWAKAKSS